MIKGKKINLRLAREDDLDSMYQHINDLSIRGPYYPMTLLPEAEFKKTFYENGFWHDEFSRMLIVDHNDNMLGQIFYFKAAIYVDALELGYLLFNEAYHGEGYTTEALQLFVDYLFANKTMNRLQLRISPEHIASIKVALKAGFQFDGTRKQIMFLHGKHIDLDEYALTRQEYEKQQREG